MDTKTYEMHVKAANMALLLAPAENDVSSHRTRPIRAFLKEFKKKIPDSSTDAG